MGSRDVQMRLRMLRLPFAAAAAFHLVAAAPADSPVGVQEPDNYWKGALHGYTPLGLKGATVVDAKAVAELVAEYQPVLLDVSDVDRKPAALPAASLWLPVHRNIPGSTWLPGAGEGDLDKTAVETLTARVAELAGGDLDRPVITYCHPNCWGSWNLGKRLLAMGYRHVYWFPEGIDAWQDGHDTAVSRPDARWSARRATTFGR